MRTCPVMKLPASEQSRSAGPTISSGEAMRFWNEAPANRSWNSTGLPRTMSVSTEPGASAFTRTPRGAKAAAIERVNDIRAAFPAAYMATSGEKMNAPTDTTFSTAAVGRRRNGRACWTRNTGPRRFTSNDLAQASVVNAPNGWARALAALLTTTSMAPNSSTVRSTRRWSWSTSPMWVGTPMAVPPSPRRCSAARWHASALRLATTTDAPEATKPSARASPIPRVPPVTMTTLPLMSNSRSSPARSIPHDLPMLRPGARNPDP